MTSSSLTQILERYATALNGIQPACQTPTLEGVLAILKARDVVQIELQTETNPAQESLVQLIQLDDRLKQLASNLTQDNQLAQCRQSLQPPETSWWWFLENFVDENAETSQLPRKESRFNWAWNLLTVVCLVGAGTFATNTAQLLSAAQGFDLIGTFSTISQGAGLALVAGGTLTEKGQKVVETILTSFKIPHHRHSQATCGAAAVLLGATWWLNGALPQLANFYYNEAKRNQDRGKLSQALTNYQRALAITPDNARMRVGLGKIYETFGELDLAEQEYQAGLLQGDPEAYHRRGEVILNRGWTARNKTYIKRAILHFQIALRNENLKNQDCNAGHEKVAKGDKNCNDALRASIHTTLGLANYMLFRVTQDDLSQADLAHFRKTMTRNLETAVALETAVPEAERWPGWGLGGCYFAAAKALHNEGTFAEVKDACYQAKPVTFAEYHLLYNILENGQLDIEEIDTSTIVTADESISKD